MSLVLCAALILMLGGGDLSSVSEDDYDFSMPFEYRLIFKNLGDIPIGPFEYLNQRFFVEQRLIFASNLYCGDVSVTTEFDVGGIIDGDLTSGSANYSRISRNHKYGWAIDRLFTREIYLQYAHNRYNFILGQKLLHWGIGMLINDGKEKGLFGENYAGDTVAGLFISIPPLFFITDKSFSEKLLFNLGYGYLIRDNFASIYYGDSGFHLYTSLEYDSESGMNLRDGFQTGIYYGYRSQKSRYGEKTVLNVFDIYFKKEHYLRGEIAAPNIFFYFEGAFIYGDGERKLGGSDYDYDIQSYGIIMRTGIRDKEYLLYLDIGYASGDDNPFDGIDSRFRFSSDFKEGLILFSELYGFASASSNLRSYNLLFEENHTFFEGVESYGSISNSIFTSINLSYSFASLLRVDLSVILAGVDKGIIDPYFSYVAHQDRNFYNSIQSSRLLGTEIDVGIEREWYQNRYFKLKSRVEYGHLFAGDAFTNDYSPFDGTDLLLFRISVDNL
ncbi:MAG: hypothetical protein ACP5QK_06850 [Myxococcota bacterium]